MEGVSQLSVLIANDKIVQLFLMGVSRFEKVIDTF